MVVAQITIRSSGWMVGDSEVTPFSSNVRFDGDTPETKLVAKITLPLDRTEALRRFLHVVVFEDC
jgi:hypothetical protein